MLCCRKDSNARRQHICRSAVIVSNYGVIMNAKILRSNVKPLIETIKQLQFKQLQFDYDIEGKVLWGYMAPNGVPNFNLEMLAEMRRFDDQLQRNQCTVSESGEQKPVEFYVAASKASGVFNLGGDLGLFMILIKSRDADGLTHYGRMCIENLYHRIQRYGSRDLTTIALVQGEALGGGFELALANDVIVAEAQARFGFPEILFNLFPGMGATSLLARRVGIQMARKLVTSGNIYSAAEMHQLGLVDVVANEGEGEAAVYQFIKDNERRWNGLRSVNRCFDLISPLSKQELNDIVDEWVSAALRIRDKDLKMMERFHGMQKKRAGSASDSVQTAVEPRAATA
jgi:DSF synthase